MRFIFPLFTGRAFAAVARPAVATARRFALFVTLLCGGMADRAVADAQCVRDGGYDRSEIAQSTFFTTRQQTKFAARERHYPLATDAAARYCFARGCAGQLTVTWTADEQQRLRQMRSAIVTLETARSELQFIKIAVLQMETWLYARLKGLEQSAVDAIMRRVAGNYGSESPDDASWVATTLSTFDRFNKECATYAMEATQHLLVLANLGLLKHWNVTAPVYRFGIPGHWTAGLENRETCERYRFDLNTRASQRHALHVKGQDPAQLALAGGSQYPLFPGMDNAGRGRPTLRVRPDLPSGASALKGPQPAVTPAPAR